jgi:hypothetical protein
LRVAKDDAHWEGRNKILEQILEIEHTIWLQHALNLTLSLMPVRNVEQNAILRDDTEGGVRLVNRLGIVGKGTSAVSVFGRELLCLTTAGSHAHAVSTAILQYTLARKNPASTDQQQCLDPAM